MTARFGKTRRKLLERLRLKGIRDGSFWWLAFAPVGVRRLVGRRVSTDDDLEDRVDLVDFEDGGLLMAETLAQHLRYEHGKLHNFTFSPECGGSTTTVPWSATTTKGRIVRGRVLLMSLLDQDAIEVRALVVVDSASRSNGQGGHGVA